MKNGVKAAVILAPMLMGWTEVTAYSGVICHEKDAAMHIAERIKTRGIAAAERSYHMIRSVWRNREPPSIISHLQPRPSHLCECAGTIEVTGPHDALQVTGAVGLVTTIEQALPHPLYTTWAYVRIVHHVSGTDAICAPLTQ